MLDAKEDEVNDLAKKRFRDAKSAGELKPTDCLQVALSELDEHNIVSAMVICIDDEGEHMTYYSGPNLSTLEKVWAVIQYEALRVVSNVRGG